MNESLEQARPHRPGWTEMNRQERNMAAEALHAYAEKILRDSQSRRWSGPDWKSMRADLRERARLYGDLGTRIYEEED